jgi:hypothetical protein
VEKNYNPVRVSSTARSTRRGQIHERPLRIPKAILPSKTLRHVYANAEGQSSMRKKLLQLCNDTLELALLVRKSESTFKFLMPELGSQPDLNLVTPMAKEPSGRRRDNIVTVVLSPAMVKFPEHDPQK